MTEVEICNLALSHVGDSKITTLTDANPAARKCNQWYAIARDSLLRSYRWNFAMSRDILKAAYKTITGAVDNGSGFIKYTSASHGFQVGQYIRVNGIVGFDVTNPQLITAVTTNLITTDMAFPPGTYASGGQATICPPHGYLYRMAIPSDCLRVLDIGDEYREDDFNHSEENGFILCDYDSATIRYIYAATDTTTFDPHFREALALELAANIVKPLTGSGSRETELRNILTTTIIPRAVKADAIEGKKKQFQEIEDSLVTARFRRQFP